MMFYVLWITRNGQRLWDGPYRLRRQAVAALNQNLHVLETGQGFIVRETS